GIAAGPEALAFAIARILGIDDMRRKEAARQQQRESHGGDQATDRTPHVPTHFDANSAQRRGPRVRTDTSITTYRMDSSISPRQSAALGRTADDGDWLSPSP